ncbi:helix-turn-helix domain-containing protein [Camelliibacillus cellulosilyticus]|uniref:Helix-turn-helix domain-containing protein n=1 Tax=Camelliibacillus cellulosilyticus TaxID=2174486 RepID=A0ABV9GLC1_9BACL
MNQEQFIQLISGKMKLIRIEKDLTQDEAANQLGISKKTLIQIEKGRNPAGWTVVVTFCTLYRDSELLANLLGDDPLELIDLIIKNGHVIRDQQPSYSKIWWQDVKNHAAFVLQQNMISGHYRILDGDGQRIYSTFDLKEAEDYLESL